MAYSRETINQVFNEGVEIVDALIDRLELIKSGVSMRDVEKVEKKMGYWILKFSEQEAQKGEENG